MARNQRAMQVDESRAQRYSAHAVASVTRAPHQEHGRPTCPAARAKPNRTFPHRYSGCAEGESSAAIGRAPSHSEVSDADIHRWTEDAASRAPHGGAAQRCGERTIAGVPLMHGLAMADVASKGQRLARELSRP